MYTYSRTKTAGYEGSIHARIKDFTSDVAQKVRAKLPDGWQADSLKPGRGDIGVVVYPTSSQGPAREGVAVFGDIEGSEMRLEVTSMYDRSDRQNVKLLVTTTPDELADKILGWWADAKKKAG